MGGPVWPVSQWRIVSAVTPSRAPASLLLILRMSRRFLMCSPRVRGSKSVSLNLAPLRRSGTGCKRATRPCLCGFRGTRTSDCRCDDAAVEKHISKLSGPLLDRIDLHVEVARIPFDEFVMRVPAEPSAAIRARVERARAIQYERYAEFTERTNAAIGAPELGRFCALDHETTLLLRTAALRGHLSARGLDRITRVSRTIADLAGCDSISAAHVAEAIGYRTLERKGLAA